MYMPTYAIATKIYLNSITKQYDKIVTISKKPSGALKSSIRQLYNRPLSEFKVYKRGVSDRCLYAIINPESGEPFCYTEVDDLINFLEDKGYTIQYNLTKLMIKNNSRSSEMGQLLFYISE